MVPGLRSLLILAAILIFFTGSSKAGYLQVIPALFLVAGSLITGRMILQYHIYPELISALAALLLFIATGNTIAPLVLLGSGFTLKHAYRAPTLEITETGIRILKTLHTKQYDWGSFNNVLLKDQLLTLDFRNNRLLQLETSYPVQDEAAYNPFCAERLEQTA